MWYLEKLTGKMKNLRLSLISSLFAVIPFFSVQAQFAPSSSLDIFPKLPPSKFCTKESIAGVWKLVMVYEVPSGSEMQTYAKYPLQYQIFEDDNLYGDYIGVLGSRSVLEARREARRKLDGFRQYVVDDSGGLFLYKDGIAVDKLACFIVASTTPPFSYGQMLLMPPQKSATARLVKVYQKMPNEPEARIPVIRSFEDIKINPVRP